jgi:adenosylmethionine-8-amino-7-oxononanoate aminotransferase
LGVRTGVDLEQGDYLYYRDRSKHFPCIESAKGVYLYDKKGKRYLDATGGPFVVNIGYGVPEIVEAIAEQARKVCFAYSADFVTEVQLELARKVIGLCPEGMSRVYFVCGGSEATETAVQFARHYFLEKGEPGKVEIVGRESGYHGATIGALSLGGFKRFKKDYEPILKNGPRVPVPYCYRCPLGREYPGCGVACAWALEEVIERNGKETIAGFISEPVSGSTLGAVSPPPEYYPIVREICDRNDVLLMVDEVVTGFGRTGRNFGIEHWNVVPDVIIAGKGISSGYAPLGAVVLHEKVYSVLSSSPKSSFFTGFTYAGNPLSCSAGNAVLDYIRKHRTVEQAAEKGKVLFEMVSQLSELSIVGDIRSKGMMMGIELVRDKKTREPFDPSRKVALSAAKNAFEEGVIFRPGHGFIDGLHGDLVIISPPILTGAGEMRTVVDCLRRNLEKFCD